MIWTVVWMPPAQQELAAVWIGSPDRNAVTRASNLIDETLAIDPELQGDCLFDTVRTIKVGPLGAEFEVDPRDMQVRVLAVWDAEKGRPEPTDN